MKPSFLSRQEVVDSCGKEDVEGFLFRNTEMLSKHHH